MTIKIHLDTMRDAEKLSSLCNKFPYELSLHAGKFCADPKSTLGVLAMMYSDRFNMLLDTGDMPDEEFERFGHTLAEFTQAKAE